LQECEGFLFEVVSKIVEYYGFGILKQTAVSLLISD